MKSTLLPASKLRMVVSASTVPLSYLVVMLPLKRGRLQRCWVSMLRATMHDAQRQGGRARHAIGNSRLRLGAEDEGAAGTRSSSAASPPAPASTAASAAASSSGACSSGACSEWSPSEGRDALGRCMGRGRWREGYYRWDLLELLEKRSLRAFIRPYIPVYYATFGLQGLHAGGAALLVSCCSTQCHTHTSALPTRMR